MRTYVLNAAFLVSRAPQKRRAALESARIAQLEDQLDDPFMSAIASTLRSASCEPAPAPVTPSTDGVQATLLALLQAASAAAASNG